MESLACSRSTTTSNALASTRCRDRPTPFRTSVQPGDRVRRRDRERLPRAAADLLVIRRTKRALWLGSEAGGPRARAGLPRARVAPAPRRAASCAPLDRKRLGAGGRELAGPEGRRFSQHHAGRLLRRVERRAHALCGGGPRAVEAPGEERG